MAESLAGRLARREIIVKSMKNIVEMASEIAMNTGVDWAGAARRSGALLGNADRLYVGDTEDGIHVTGPLLFGREQEPRGPKKTVGPSIPRGDEEFVSSNDGDTVRRATLL